MPSALASTNGERVMFNEQHVVQQVPAGEYEGEIVPTSYEIGGNGMDRKFDAVRIHGGTLDGSIVHVWSDTPNAEASNSEAAS